MGKTVYYTPTEDNKVRPTAEEWQRIDERAEQGGAAYYEDIPEVDAAFFRNARAIRPEEEKEAFAAAAASMRGRVSIDLAPDTLAQLETEAEREGTETSTLVRQWVLERLESRAQTAAH